MNPLEKVLKNKNFSAVFLVLSVLVALVVPHLSRKVLKPLKMTTVKIMALVLIVGLSLVDPVKALLLAIILVVALQRLSDVCKSNNDIIKKLFVEEELNDEGSDEASDEVGDEGAEPESAFDETEDDEPTFKSELLENTPVNEVELNSVNNPVVVQEVAESNTREKLNYNSEPMDQTKVLPNTEEEPLKLNVEPVGNLLQEGFEDVLNNSTLNNSMVDKHMKTNDTTENSELNNVLTANIPEEKVENSLENVEVKVFTNKNQLKDIGTNLVNCLENNEGIKSGKNQLGAQGLEEIEGYSW